MMRTVNCSCCDVALATAQQNIESDVCDDCVDVYQASIASYSDKTHETHKSWLADGIAHYKDDFVAKLQAKFTITLVANQWRDNSNRPPKDVLKYFYGISNVSASSGQAVVRDHENQPNISLLCHTAAFILRRYAPQLKTKNSLKRFHDAVFSVLKDEFSISADNESMSFVFHAVVQSYWQSGCYQEAIHCFNRHFSIDRIAETFANDVAHYDLHGFGYASSMIATLQVLMLLSNENHFAKAVVFIVGRHGAGVVRSAVLDALQDFEFGESAGRIMLNSESVNNQLVLKQIFEARAEYAREHSESVVNNNSETEEVSQAFVDDRSNNLIINFEKNVIESMHDRYLAFQTVRQRQDKIFLAEQANMRTKADVALTSISKYHHNFITGYENMLDLCEQKKQDFFMFYKALLEQFRDAIIAHDDFSQAFLLEKQETLLRHQVVLKTLTYQRHVEHFAKKLEDFSNQVDGYDVANDAAIDEYKARKSGVLDLASTEVRVSSDLLSIAHAMEKNLFAQKQKLFDSTVKDNRFYKSDQGKILTAIKYVGLMAKYAMLMFASYDCACSVNEAFGLGFGYRFILAVSLVHFVNFQKALEQKADLGSMLSFVALIICGLMRINSRSGCAKQGEVLLPPPGTTEVVDFPIKFASLQP